MRVLRARLLERQVAERQAEEAAERRAQVGHRRAVGEDPHLQLPAGPRDRSPREAHPRKRRGRARRATSTSSPRRSRPRSADWRSSGTPWSSVEPCGRGAGPAASRVASARDAVDGGDRRARRSRLRLPAARRRADRGRRARRSTAARWSSTPIDRSTRRPPGSSWSGSGGAPAASRSPTSSVDAAFAASSWRVDRRALIPRPETELLVEVAIELVAPRGQGPRRGHGLGRRGARPARRAPGSAGHRLRRLAGCGRRSRARTPIGSAWSSRSWWVPSCRRRWRGTGPSTWWSRTCPTSATTSGRCSSPRSRSTSRGRRSWRGADGLDAIRALVDAAPSGTRLALEHAPDQGAGGACAARRGGDTRLDLAGRERVTVGTVP